MSTKPAPLKPADPEQYARFLEVAREVGADDEARDFDQILGRLGEMPREPKEARQVKKRKPPQ